MESDSKTPGDDDNYMADVETEANSAPMETARQGSPLAGSTNTPSQQRVPATFVKNDDQSGDSAMFDSLTARSRFLRLSDTPPDPPKFRRRRFPGPGRPPAVPVMSTPPRDQSGWRKVLPCILNPEGHTVPLDKRRRVSEDREEVRRRINDNFARLLESLRAAEVKAREAFQMRSAKLRESRAKLTERRERDVRQLAATALAERAARAAAAAPPAPPPAPVSAGKDTGAELPSEAKHIVSEFCGAYAEQQLKKVTTKTDQGLSAGAPARAAGKRERPVELDEPEQSDDPFDLDGFMAKFASLGMDEFDLDELLQSMLHIK